MRIVVVALVLPAVAVGAVVGASYGVAAGVVGGWVFAPAVVLWLVFGYLALRGVATMFDRSAAVEEGPVWPAGFALVFGTVFAAVFVAPGWAVLAGTEPVTCEVVGVVARQVYDQDMVEHTVHDHRVACPGGYPETYRAQEPVDRVAPRVDPDRRWAPEDAEAALVLLDIGYWLAGVPAAVYLLAAGIRGIGWRNRR